MPVNDNLKWVYGQLTQSGANMGTIDDFEKAMGDEANRKWAYDYAEKHGVNLGSMDDFTNAIMPAKQEYPKAVVDRYNAPENSAPNFKDIAQINDEYQQEMKSRPETVKNLAEYVGKRESVREGLPELQMDSLAADTDSARPIASVVNEQQPIVAEKPKDLASYITSDELPQEIRKQSDLNAKLRDAYLQRDELAKKIENEFSEKIGWNLLPEGLQNFMKKHSSSELGTAYRANEERIRMLENAKNKDDAGFWKGVEDALNDPSVQSFGVSSLIDTMNKMRAAQATENLPSNIALSNEQQLMLENEYKNKQAQQEYGDDQSFMYRAGQISMQALPFVAEFLATGGFGSIASKGAALGRLAGSKTSNAALKWLLRSTGTVGGDVAAATAMANTTGAAKTMSDVVGRYLGNVAHDEKGNYSFEGGKSLGRSIYEGEVSNALEYYTEMLGEHIPMGKIADKVGLSKLAKSFESITSNGWGKVAGDVLKRAQIQSYPSEVLEEEANIVLNSLLVGDQKMSDLVDSRTQADIWGGMLFSIGFMNSLPVAAGLSEAGVNRAKYYRQKHSVDKADNVATSALSEEKWSPLREQIDNTPNEQFADMSQAIINDPSLQDNEKKAALYYMSELTKLRGYNMGEMAKAKDAVQNGVTPEQKVRMDVDTSYSAGYEATDEQKNLLKNQYEAALEELENAFSDQAVGWFEEDPIGTLRLFDKYEPEKIQVAIDYINAKTAYEGMINRVQDDIDSEIAAADEQVNQQVNATSGTIQPVVLKNGNREAYVVNGELALNEDGTIDLENSQQDVIVRDKETNKLSFVPVSDIASADAPMNPDELKAANADAIRQAKAQEQASIIDGTLEFADGDTYQAVGEDGTPVEITIISQNGDGTLNVGINGEASGEPMRKEALQQMVDRFKLQQTQTANIERRAAQVVQQQPGQEVAHAGRSYQLNEQVPVTLPDGMPGTAFIQSEPNADGQYEVELQDANGTVRGVSLMSQEQLNDMEATQPVTEQEPTPTPAEAPVNLVQSNGQEAAEQVAPEEEMPMIGEGDNIQPDYDSVTAQRAHKYIYEENGLDEKDADQLVQLKRKAADENLKKIIKSEPKFGDKGIGDNIIKFKQAHAAWQEQVDMAQRQVEYWNAVEQEQAMVIRQREQVAAEAAEQERLMNMTDAEKMQQHDLSLMEPRNLTELAAQMLGAGRIKLLRDAYKKESGYGNEEARKLLRIFAGKEKGGISVERAGEQLLDMADAMNIRYDNTDANAGRNAILDVLQDVETWGDLVNYITNSRKAETARLNAEQKRHEEEQRNAWYQEQFGMGYEDFENRYVPTIAEEFASVPDDDFVTIFTDEYKPIQDEQARNEEERIEESPEVLSGTQPVLQERAGRVEEESEATPVGERGENESVPEEPLAESESTEQEKPNDKLGYNANENTWSGVPSDVQVYSNGEADRMGDIYGYTPNQFINIVYNKPSDTTVARVWIVDDYAESPVKILAQLEKEGIDFDLHGEIGYYVDILDYPHAVKFEQHIREIEKKAHEKDAEEKAQQVKKEGYIVEPYTYVTKKGREIQMKSVKFDVLDNDVKKRLGGLAREMKGWWDRNAESFLLRDDDSVNKLVEEYKQITSEETQQESEPSIQPQQIDVAGVFDELKEKGTAKLSDHVIEEKEQQPKEYVVQYNPDIEDDYYDRRLARLREQYKDNLPTDEYIESKIEDKNKDVELYRKEAETATNDDYKARALTSLASSTGQLRAFQTFLRELPKRRAEMERDKALADHGVKLGDKIWYKGEKATIYDADSKYVTLDTGMAPVIYETTEWGNVNLLNVEPAEDESKQKQKIVDDLKREIADAVAANKKFVKTVNNKKNNQTILDNIKRKAVEDAFYSLDLKRPEVQLMLDIMGDKGVTKDFVNEIVKLSDVEKQTQEDSQAGEYGANNSLVSQKRYEELKAKMKKKLGGQMNLGVDPEILAIGTEMALYHIEAGARQFADYAKAMINDLGDTIRPYLKSFYNGARDLPETAEAGYDKEMTPHDEVSKFDVTNFDKRDIDVFETADNVVREQEVEQEAAQAKDAMLNIAEAPEGVRMEMVDGEPVYYAHDGTRIRPLTEEDIENDRWVIVYYKGYPTRIMSVIHEGEQVNAGQFEKPKVKTVYLTNASRVPFDQLFVADEELSQGNEKKFIFNEHGVCLNPNEIEYKHGSNEYKISTAHTERGWSGARSTSHSTGGASSGVSAKDRDKFFDTEEECQAYWAKVALDDFVDRYKINDKSIINSLNAIIAKGEDKAPAAEVKTKKAKETKPAKTKEAKTEKPVKKEKPKELTLDLFSQIENAENQENNSGKARKNKEKSVTSQREVETSEEPLRSERTDEQKRFSLDVAYNMTKALDNGKGQKPYRSIVDLRNAAKEVGMNVDDDGRDDILLQELVEDGLVSAGRAVIDSGNYGARDSKAAYDAIVKLYDMQPTIAQRSSNRLKMAQFSTPLPMAFVADMLAYRSSMSKVLEPTAGNGMLVFAVPADKVYANELDSTRLANLRDQKFASVTNQDATEPFPGGKQYDAVIANPPFGSRPAKEYDGKEISGLDPQIALNALESMKDDGKAAIIIGGNMEYAKNGSIKNQKAFFTYLYDHYYVKGVIDMDGKLYAKQGTTYPTRMIVIDGRRSDEDRAQTVIYPPVESKAIRKANSFDELYEIANELRNSKNKTNGTEVLRSQQGQLVPVDNQSSRDTEGRGRDKQPRKDDSKRPGGKTVVGTAQGDGQSVLRGESGQNTGNGETARTSAGSEQGAAGGRLSANDNQQLGAVGDAESRARLDTPSENIIQGEKSKTTNKGDEKRQLNQEKLPYRPHNTSFSLESVAPAAMVEAMDKTLTEIEKKYGNIDDFVTKELEYDTIDDMHDALAAEQVDAVAMAIYQMKQGKAFIIGDQTGVGKGRQMAALIRWAVKRGEKPIFITQKADLFTDIYRDLVDIGSGDLNPFIFNSDGAMQDTKGNVIYKPLPPEQLKKVLAGESLPDEYDYAVLTYSQVNTGDFISAEMASNKAKASGERSRKSNIQKTGKATPKATFLRKIANDNYMFLDESHTAAGSSNTGAYLQSLVSKAKGVTFASATFAKRPDTMPLYALRSAMSEANVKQDELIKIIEKGGVTLQEIMSRALTDAGQMVRRERDMSDVVTDWKTIDDPATVKKARENYDRTISAFNAIIQFQEQYVKPKIDALDAEIAAYAETANVKKGTDKMGVENVPFASKTYNYTKQLMLALKVDAIADEVDKEIKAGRHPVIALESTMESSIKDYSPGNVIEEPTFSASLLRGLQTVMQYTIKDENGNETHAHYSPAELGAEGEKAYYELQDYIREATSDIYISPLDAIIDRLHQKGYKVGELTGRNLYVEIDDEGKSVVRRRTDKDKKQMQRDFNSGVLDVLILNKSASTGISLHASKKFSDQRQRTMIIAQPLSDINDYMQMIGRIDRTGQVHRGYYINLGLPVPAENRFLMMLSTKLKSLNANTTTSQDSESNDVEAPDLLNKYGSQVVVEYLRDNPEIYVKMGKPLKSGNGQVEVTGLDEYVPSEDDARKITGYVALLSTQEQDDFYNDVVQRYNDLIRYLNETGNNDLKITVMPLQAKTQEKKVSSEGKNPYGHNPFAQNAYVETVEMNILRKPMKADEIRKMKDRINNGKSVDERRMEIIKTQAAETEAKRVKEEERYQAAKQKAVEDIARQTEKINAQKKRTDEEKQAAIERYANDVNERVETTHATNLQKLASTQQSFEGKMHRFDDYYTYLVPDDLDNPMFNVASPAIFVGYKAKDSKVSPSTTVAVFATLDGRRAVEVKLSDPSQLLSIESATNQNFLAAQQTTLENWDSQIPTSARKTGHIMTGNILQAVKDTQDERGNYPGQLISYTDIDGNIHDGILMPDRWNTSMMVNSGAPINAKLSDIKNGKLVRSKDNKVVVAKDRWGGYYTLTVPRSRKEGGKYFQNEDILNLVDSHNFYPYRGDMRADIDEKNIGRLVNILAEMGVRVSDEADANQRMQRAEGGVSPVKEDEALLVEGLADVLRDAGIPVSTDIEESEQVADAINALPHRVYHGSGAEFAAFDHSHIGEGEGAQAYGWGSYVTEVEGIGISYASQKNNRIKYQGKSWEELWNNRNEIYGSLAAMDVITEMERGSSFEEALEYLRREYQGSYNFYEMDESNGDSNTAGTAKSYKDRLDALSTFKEEDFEINNNKILYTVDIPEDNGHNYLGWVETIDKSDRRRIANAVRKLDGRPAESVMYRKYDGGWNQLADMIERNQWAYYEVKNRLVQAFGGKLSDEKKVSDLMHNTGFVGVSYPANFRSIFKTGKAKNFVIFDEKDLNIVDKVKLFRTPTGELYGFVLNGKIYIDPRIATAETPIHEYGHLWTYALRTANPKAWDRLKEQLLGKQDVLEYVQRVYPELSGDDLMDEVFQHYAGKRGAARLRREQRRMEADAERSGEGIFGKARIVALFDTIRRAVRNFWQQARDLFAGNVNGIENMTAEDFADMMLGDLLGGFDPTGGGVYMDSSLRPSKVTDPKLLNQLESGDKQTGYRNVVLNDEGVMNSPMAYKLGKKGMPKVSTQPFNMSEWEQSDEHPDLATDDGKINLYKPNGKEIGSVDYNPYVHIRPTMVNKQFKEAWKRPELVYIETEYPTSELTSGYHADKAKLSVGKHPWNGGELVLSRYDKPVKVMSWEQVADDWEKEFEGIGVPFDIVPPDLLPILARRNVEILPPHKGTGKDCEAAYNKFLDNQKEKMHKSNVSVGNVSNEKPLSFDEAEAAARKFEKENRGAAKTIVIDRRLDFKKQLADNGITGKKADLYEQWFEDGKTMAFYTEKYDCVIFLRPNIGKDLFNAYLWHENFHRSLVELYGVGDNKDRVVLDYFNKLNVPSNDLQELEEEVRNDYTGESEQTIEEEYLAAFLECYYLSSVNPEEAESDPVEDAAAKAIEDNGGLDLYKETLYYIKNGRKRELLSDDSEGSTSERNADQDEHSSQEENREVRNSNGANGRNEEKRKVAPAPTITMRDKVYARNEYEQMIKSGLYQFREAVQDSMRGLYALYKSVLGKEFTNIEDVPGFENAYLAENRMSSMSAAEQHDYFRQYMTPLLETIGKLTDGKEDNREELMEYMMAKHGLERNVVMAERDARIAEEGGGDYDDALTHNRERDYSGLTALTGEEDVQAAEIRAREIVDQYESSHDTQLIDELWDRTRGATRSSLTKLYMSGLMSNDSYQRTLGMFEYYIPLRGWEETTSDEVYGYLTSNDSPLLGSVLKKAGGRTSVADDPIAYIGQMADKSIMEGNRNRMKQTFLNFVLNHPSDLVSVSDIWMQHDDINDEWVAVFPELEPTDTAEEVERKVADFENTMTQMATADPEHFKRSREFPDIPYKVIKNNKREHQVLVKRNGRAVLLTINGNPRAAQALNGLTNPDVDVNGVVGNLLRAGEYINRNLSAFYTTRNPDFVVSNFLRDMVYSNVMAWVKENPRYAMRFHRNVGKLNPAIMRKLLGKWESGTLDGTNYTERMFALFMLNGGETGYTSVRDLEAHKKNIADELKKQGSTARKAWDALGMQLDLMNRSVENCARFAAFVTSREMGRSMERSIYDAKEVSVNFNKKGSGGKMVNTVGMTPLGKAGAYISGLGRVGYVFWNAGVQGMTNFGRAGKKNTVKALTGGAAMYMLGQIIPLLWGGDGDDDDKNAYYNLPEYIRRNSICINAGDQWITIPLPIELRGIYGMGELATGVITGNERYSNQELAYQIASQMSQILPLDMLEGGGGITPLIPSSFKPIVEAYVLNKRWSGLPIYKDTPYNKNDPEWTKAYKSADQTMVGISKFLNEISGGDDFKKGAIDINPSKVEYLLSGVLGGYENTVEKLKKMGETATGQRDFEWRNMLLANRVLTSGDESTEYRKLQNEFYRYKDEADETKRLLKKYENADNEGILGMAEKIDFLENSDQYRRYEIYEEYKDDINAYQEMIKESTDKEERRQYEREMYDIVKEMLSQMKQKK